MSQQTGMEHEQEVLEAFQRMTDDFRQTKAVEPVEERVPMDSVDALLAAEAPLATPSRAERFGKKKPVKESAKAQKSKAAADVPAQKKASSEKKKKEKKPKKKFSLFRYFLKAILFVIVLLIIVGLLVAAFAFSYVKSVIEDTPDINPGNVYEMLSENSFLVDSDGELIEYIYSGDSLRSNIEFRDLPDNLKDAFVAIEDKTFWEHHGFNFVRIGGAIYEFVRSRGDDRISGTSTITQQLARNIYLSDIKSVRSVERKLQEAYYTYVIEQALSKEQILEVYLNTIYLGYNSNGVSAAAEAYFSKDVSELNLLECAILASLPQSPNNYAPIKRASTAEIKDMESLDVITSNDRWTVYYNNAGEDRVRLVLRMMYEQGKITEQEYNAAKSAKIRDYINPGTTVMTTSRSSYFADYVVEEVIDDLCWEMDMTEDEARTYLNTGGLTIHSTLNTTIQTIMEEVYANGDIFPDVGKYDKDKEGNVLNEARTKILLYNMANLFDEEGNYALREGEFEWQTNGDLKLFKDNRLNFYKTQVGDNTDFSVEFKPMFEIDDDNETGSRIFYSRTGGTINIPSKYKERDGNGDLIISKDFFKDKPDFFTRGEGGSLILAAGSEDAPNYTLQMRVMQPQSAMTIIDYTTGHIVGMVGGRGIEGKLLYNRATAPRQPGSSIKPLSVYSVALQAGADGLGNFTAAMPLDDAPVSYGGKAWPKNWYSGYKGMTNMRKAVEQSINTCAVNLFNLLDPYKSMEQLQNMGVTSLVTSGPVNDINASALALGGMTRGISPLEMAGAYGTFGNYGIHTQPISYTTITNKKGDVIFTNIADKTYVMDEAVASLMTDILHSVVTRGLGTDAKLSSQPTAGKTGTTSDRFDIWFVGMTPKYSAATWIGNDVNIPLDTGSSAATKLWAKVMEQVGELDEKGEFEMRGDFVTATVDKYSGKPIGDLSSYDSRGTALSEIFIAGTVPGEKDDAHVMVEVCKDSGYLATPLCEHVVSRVGIIRPSGQSWEKTLSEFRFGGLGIFSLPDAKYDAPDFYCPIHNPDPSEYPISPRAQQRMEDGDGTSGFIVDQAAEDEDLDVEYDEFGNPIVQDPDVLDPDIAPEDGQGQTGGETTDGGSAGSTDHQGAPTPSDGGQQDNSGASTGEGSQPSDGSGENTGSESGTPDGGTDSGPDTGSDDSTDTGSGAGTGPDAYPGVVEEPPFVDPNDPNIDNW